MKRPAILVLAAGASSRMAPRDKLMEQVGGEAMIRRQVRLAVETGCPVYVALRPDRAKALIGLNFTAVQVENPAQGMAASLQAGLNAARRANPPGLMILPADMPEFTLAALNAMIQAWATNPAMIWRGQAETGQPGHPAIFPSDLFADLARIQGDQGGRAVLITHAQRVCLFPLPGLMAITDLDTPEDWANWRARQP